MFTRHPQDRKLSERSLESVDNVMLGAADKTTAINFIIILIKQHIVQCKQGEPDGCDFAGVDQFIDYRFGIDRCIAVSNDREQ